MGVFYRISVEKGQIQGPPKIQNFHPPSNFRRFDPPYPGLQQKTLEDQREERFSTVIHNKITYTMESQTRVSKRTPREFQNWRVQGNPLTLRNPSPTLCQPFANPSPTFRQPFANHFCQPLSKPLFPWAPGTGLETRVSGFLDTSKYFLRTLSLTRLQLQLHN